VQCPAPVGTVRDLSRSIFAVPRSPQAIDDPANIVVCSGSSVPAPKPADKVMIWIANLPSVARQDDDHTQGQCLAWPGS